MLYLFEFFLVWFFFHLYRTQEIAPAIHSLMELKRARASSKSIPKMLSQTPPMHASINLVPSYIHSPYAPLHPLLFPACPLLSGEERRNLFDVPVQNRLAKQRPRDDEDHEWEIAANDINTCILGVGGKSKLTTSQHPPIVCPVVPNPPSAPSRSLGTVRMGEARRSGLVCAPGLRC